MLITAQKQAGPAAGEGRQAYRDGKTIEQCLAESYYANKARMMSGGYHVARGYADAAFADGCDAVTKARIIMMGHNHRRQR